LITQSTKQQSQLAAFAALHGWDPDQGAQLILEAIGFHIDNSLEPAPPPTSSNTRAQPKTIVTG